jgi:hypothetical protein
MFHCPNNVTYFVYLCLKIIGSYINLMEKNHDTTPEPSDNGNNDGCDGSDDGDEPKDSEKKSENNS